MASRKRSSFRAGLAITAAVLLLAACATAPRLQREGLEMIEAGRYEDGLARLEAASHEDPRDATYRASFANSRDSITLRLLAAADRANSDGKPQEAEALYRRVLGIDSKNARALDGLRSVERQKPIADFLQTAQAALKRGDLETAQKAVDSALLLNGRHPGANALRQQIDEAKAKELPLRPQVKSKFGRPVSLEFRDANLKMVFDVLARTSGINFIFDRDVKSDLKATIFVKQVAIEDAIDLLLVQNQLDKKVINDNTILIYPGNPQKIKEYQELTVKSFYLTNADVKQTLNMIKTILKTRDIFIDEKLNLLVMRDTPDAIRLAEKLIASQDLAEPEVMLEIEVLELNRNKLLDLGIQWPSKLTSPSLAQNTWQQFRNQLQINNFTVDRGAIISILNTDSDSRQLASPRIRVRSKEKAKIHIGDKVPVVTATIAATAGTTPVTTDTIQYIDVGIKLEVEPTVHNNDEVAIKLNLDVSSATQLPQTKNGSIPIQVSTRNATTLLRLKDGETQALAGLLRSSLALTRDKVPGVGDVPFFGHLFGSNRNDDQNTELVLLVTPHIVRNLQRADVGLAESYSGTEATLRVKPLIAKPVGEGETLPLTGISPESTATPVAPSSRGFGSGANPPAAPAATPSAPVPPGAQAPDTGAAPGGALALSWDTPGELKVGEEATVQLRVRADQPLLSTALQIGYDPQAIKVVDAAEGDLLKQDGTQTTFSSRIDETAGRVFLGLARPGQSGIVGDGTLVQLRVAGVAAKPKSPLRVVVFSAIGPGNRLLQGGLPPPTEISVVPR